jgi:hypothetical protein
MSGKKRLRSALKKTHPACACGKCIDIGQRHCDCCQCVECENEGIHKKGKMLKLPSPSCIRRCVPGCRTILEHLSVAISICQKCSPVIHERRRRFDIQLIRENRALTMEEVYFIVGWKV